MPEVIVIGGANLDIKAQAQGLSVPGTSNPGEVRFTAGGVARNIAHNLAMLAVNTALVTALGDDEAAELIIRGTHPALDLSMALHTKGRSGSYVAMLDGRGELLGAVNDMTVLEHLEPDVIRRHDKVLAAARLIIADCNLPEASLAMLAADYGEKLLVEPVSIAKAQKLVNLLKSQSLYLATPNRDQFKVLCGTAGGDRLPSGLHSAVVHCGSDGALVYDGVERHALPPCSAATVADVTGAGDAAVSGLAYALLRGYDLLAAARYGQAAAALKLSSTQSTPDRLTPATLEEMVHRAF